MADGVRTLTTQDYPASLREIPKPPSKLWMRGAFAPASTRHLAVVGSRALSRYGLDAVNNLVGGLTGYPISIVSGLALGADAAAHRAALACGLHTLAVPGSGLDDEVIAPKTNLGLAHEILAAGGGLLSEHEPNEISRPEYFPSRNRIMVGIADAVLVIEAGEQSGTLITARLTTEYNRELLCVPHRIGDTHAAGNWFIRSGATLVYESAHILEALGLPIRESGTRAEVTLEGAEYALYELLESPTPRDELIRASALAPHEALTALVTLELKGLAKEEFGAWRRT